LGFWLLKIQQKIFAPSLIIQRLSVQILSPVVRKNLVGDLTDATLAYQRLWSVAEYPQQTPKSEPGVKQNYLLLQSEM
jgi:hypothetical protein